MKSFLTVLLATLTLLVGCVTADGPRVRVIDECPTGSHYDDNCYVPARKGITQDQIEEGGGDITSLIDLIDRKPGVTVDRQRLTISIRGAMKDPLFVMDGMPLHQWSARDFLVSVSPSDIQDIRILKGTDTALYGIHGANGVIIVRTKN